MWDSNLFFTKMNDNNICKCGHPQSLHLSDGKGVCDQYVSQEKYCKCEKFLPSAPAPKEDEIICLDCYAHNIQPDHVCPPWLKELVRRKNEKVDHDCSAPQSIEEICGRCGQPKSERCGDDFIRMEPINIILKEFWETLYPNFIFEGGDVVEMARMQNLADQYAKKLESFIRQKFPLYAKGEIEKGRGEGFNAGMSAACEATEPELEAARNEAVEDFRAEKIKEIEKEAYNTEYDSMEHRCVYNSGVWRALQIIRSRKPNQE
jgi:hypothetical protein